MSDDDEHEQHLNIGYDSDSGDDDVGSNNKRGGKKKSKGGFHAMKLSDATMMGIKFLGFKQPTPIQRKAIPPALMGRDLVAMARTGSGKTASFLIPAVELLSRSGSAAFRCIILSPTRELAIQTYTIAQKLAKKTQLKLCLLHGGDSKVAQFDALSANPDMLVCTPGRLADLLNETQDFSLANLQLLVIDEADRLFEMNFQTQLHEIFERMPKEKQTLLFSATLPKELAEFARVKLNSDTVDLIRLDTDMRISDTLKLTFLKVRNLDERLAALLHVLRTVIKCKEESSIIFCATKQQVEYLVHLLREMENLTGITQYDHLGIGMAHGSMDQEARSEAINLFRAAKLRVLITTDLAARGLDIPLVNNVINFDFPDKSKLFVHRVGRAARQGRSGHAVSFVAVEEMSFYVDVCLYLGGEDESARIGTLPQPILDEGVEWESMQRKDNAELQQMYKSSVNAHKMYAKTRVEPSKRSMKRAKEMQIGLHPMFVDTAAQKAAEGAADQVEGSVSVQDLAKFRPKRTTFETELSKGGSASASSAASKALEFARTINVRKALNHELPAASEQQQESKIRLSAAQKRKLKQKQLTKDAAPIVIAPAPGAPTGQFRDERFFISNESSGGQNALDNDFESQLRVHHFSEAVLDLNPDDTEGMAKKSRSFQWDKRKKKYIQSTLKDHVAAKRIKVDADLEKFGSNNMKKGEAYEKWARKTRKRIGGSEPTGDVTDVAQLALLRRQAKRANNPEYAPGRRTKDEVKNEDQIVKDYKQKAKKTARLKAKAEKTKTPRKKAGEDAKVNRVGRQKTKPQRWSRSYVK